MTSPIRTLGRLTAAITLVGAGLLTSTAAPAAAATTTVFPLDGYYAVGGRERPHIKNNNDILTVDMSGFRRPNARGIVIDSDTISVTFPDDRNSPYFGQLAAQGTITWDNGSVWTRTNEVRVPNIIFKGETEAVDLLRADGFVPQFAGLVGTEPNCNDLDRVAQQSPLPRTFALPGTVVRYWIGVPQGQC